MKEEPTHQFGERRLDIDWLRVIATYLLFVFHTAKVFDIPPFYQIKNSEQSYWLGYLTGFIHLWHMPLFFTLAGWSAAFSLSKRGGAGFFSERVKRIFIPFIMGCVLLCPPMQYLYVKQFFGYSGDFFDFMTVFFTLKYFSWSHLWFLIYLFVFTILYLPLFRYIASKNRSIAKVHPVVLFSPVILFIFIQITLRERWPGFQNLYDDWANFAWYSTYFIAGFFIGAIREIESLLHDRWQSLFGIGLFLTALLGIFEFFQLGVSEVIKRSLAAPVGYFTVLGMMGFAHHHLSFADRRLPWLVESAFPVYILHQSSIVIPGYFIVQLPLGIAVKYFILFMIAVASTMAVYQFAVKRFYILRFLFGMKTR